MVRQCVKFWALQFSRFFEVIPSSRDSKFLLRGNDKTLVIAINFSGVYGIDSKENLLFSVKFIEIRHVELVRSIRDVPFGIIIETVQGKSMQFNCISSTDMFELISRFLEGLKARSRFVVATRKIEKHQVEPGFLTFDKGDLLILDDVAGQNLMTSSWGAARNERSGMAGSVQEQNVWILSTLQKPEESMIKLLKMNDLELEKLNRKNMAATAVEMSSNPNDNFYTLEEYAAEFFRRDTKSQVSSVISVKSGNTVPDWCKATEPIQGCYSNSIKRKSCQN